MSLFDGNLAFMPVAVDRIPERSPTEAWHFALLDHLIESVNGALLDLEPFCHSYMEGVFPSDLYFSLLRHLPSKEFYDPLNLRKWVRRDGTSTRDQFSLTSENLSKLPQESAA